MASCEAAPDRVLGSELGALGFHRRLFKAIDLTGVDSPRVKFDKQARDLLESKKRDPEYALAHDSPADTPYKPYDPARETSAPQIFVEYEPEKVGELSSHSDMVHDLAKRYTLVRYYCPAEVRDELERIAEKVK